MSTQSREAIVAQVKDIVAEVLKKTPADIDEHADFETLGADSLDRLTLIMSLEDALNYSITDDEAKNLKTVAQVVAFIELKKTADNTL